MRKIGVPGVIAAGGAVTHALAGSCGAFTDVRVLEFVLDSLLYNVSINMNINDETIGRFVLLL